MVLPIVKGTSLDFVSLMCYRDPMTLIRLLFITLLIFSNSMFYTSFLLLLVVVIVAFLYSNSFVSSISSLILVLVYVGAIMVLVGYICAVSPNIVTRPKASMPRLILLLVVITISFKDPIYSNLDSQLNPLKEFYSIEL